MNDGGLIELYKKGVLEGDKITTTRICEHRIYDKKTKVKFGIGKHTTRGILDYIHGDLWGPSTTSSVGGSR